METWFRNATLSLVALGLATFFFFRREGSPALESAIDQTSGPVVAIEGLPRVAVLGQRGIQEFEIQGEKSKIELSFTPVEGQPFDRALRASIKEASNAEWTVQIQAKNVAPVEKGDALLATFYLRAVTPQASGHAETQFVFERAGEPYTKSIAYPIFPGSAWRKVQLRFSALESYAPGQAQIIFRLGYEPEVIEIGGVAVENFGKSVRATQLPSTEVADSKPKPQAVKEAPLPVVDGGELAFDVVPAKTLGTISPYVYGINSQSVGETRAALRRMGGNRQTLYNWEINASNAGADYHHQNDEWACTNLGYKNCNAPGAQMTEFVAANSKARIDSLIVVPMLDYVAADKAGPVQENDKAPSQRFVRAHAQKPGSEYELTPDRNDDAVYQDELVNFLVHELGRADRGGIKFYALDNEPGLWHVTHPRVHPQPATYEEVVSRSESTASMITKIDPSAEVLGGTAFGWSEYMSLAGSPDSKGHNDKYGSYLDYFLASMKGLEQKHRRRLVHVLDVHWYPEVRGNQRVIEDDVTQRTVAARLEAPRSLWDPEFRERSWIDDQWKKPIRLFPWLKERIAERYPGTKVAMTEYNFGAGDHISGGLAQADVLGILGAQGVYIANYWGKDAGVGELPPYVAAAFRLYRNYDGKAGQFGDVAVQSNVKDIRAASIHAAQHSKDRRLTILIINKDQQKGFTGKIRIEQGGFVRAQPYLLDGSSASIRPLPSTPIHEGTLTHHLPRLSATLFVCEPG